MKASIAKGRGTKPGKPHARISEPKRGLAIKSLLVPLDFSNPSLKALTYAAALAEQFGAKLTLLYVIEPIASVDFTTSFPLMLGNDELLANAKVRLLASATKRDIDAELIENAIVRQGRAHHEITEAARTLKSDVIVISTHGYSGLSHALLGSVTERVVRHAPCPVFVVREQEHDILTTKN